MQTVTVSVRSRLSEQTSTYVGVATIWSRIASETVATAVLALRWGIAVPRRMATAPVVLGSSALTASLIGIGGCA